MAGNITKPLSDRDANQTLQSAYNDVDATISVNGFLVGKVGNKITLAVTTTNVSNDTYTYTFLDNGNQLYQLQIIYTDNTQSQMISAARIA